MRIWPTIGGRMRLTDLARARVEQQLAALCAHEAGVRTADDPENVHQMRVASRRLRAALRLFEAVLPPAASSLQDELAWIAAALGEVRDLDVQIASLARAGSGLRAESEALRAVLCLFDARRSAAPRTRPSCRSCCACSASPSMTCRRRASSSWGNYPRCTPSACVSPEPKPPPPTTA